MKPIAFSKDDQVHPTSYHPFSVGELIFTNSSNCFTSGTYYDTTYCGNGVCEYGESAYNCPSDCYGVPSGSVTANLIQLTPNDTFGQGLTDLYVNFGATTQGSIQFIWFIILTALSGAVGFYAGIYLGIGVFYVGTWVIWGIGGFTLLIPLGITLALAVLLMWKFFIGQSE